MREWNDQRLKGSRLGNPGDFSPGAAWGTGKTLERPMVAWVVLCLCLFVTFIGWQVSLSQLQRRGRDRFQRNVEQVTQSIQARIQGYEQVLKGAAGLFAASDDVRRDEWKQYVSLLEINERFPGIRALGYIAHVPRRGLAAFIATNRLDDAMEFNIHTGHPDATRLGTNPVHYVVQFVEPMRGNGRALGYDIASEANRREAAERARDTGEAALTARIQLVQTEDDLPAVILMLPIYRQGLSVTNTAKRRAAVQGWVYGAFVMRDLMAGLIETRDAAIDFEIFDGTRATGLLGECSTTSLPARAFAVFAAFPEPPHPTIVPARRAVAAAWRLRGGTSSSKKLLMTAISAPPLTAPASHTHARACSIGR